MLIPSVDNTSINPLCDPWCLSPATCIQLLAGPVFDPSSVNKMNNKMLGSPSSSSSSYFIIFNHLSSYIVIFHYLYCPSNVLETHLGLTTYATSASWHRLCVMIRSMQWSKKLSYLYIYTHVHVVFTYIRIHNCLIFKSHHTIYPLMVVTLASCLQHCVCLPHCAWYTQS